MVVHKIKVTTGTINVIQQEIRAGTFGTIVPLCIQFSKETGVQRITNTCADDVCREKVGFGQLNPVPLISRFNRQLLGHPPLTVNVDAQAVAVEVISDVHTTEYRKWTTGFRENG